MSAGLCYGPGVVMVKHTYSVIPVCTLYIVHQNKPNCNTSLYDTYDTQDSQTETVSCQLASVTALV